MIENKVMDNEVPAGEKEKAPAPDPHNKIALPDECGDTLWNDVLKQQPFIKDKSKSDDASNGPD